MGHHPREVKDDIREIIRRCQGHGCPHVENKPCDTQKHDCNQCILDWGTAEIVKIIKEQGDV